MKKVCSFILTLAMCLTLCACNAEDVLQILEQLNTMQNATSSTAPSMTATNALPTESECTHKWAAASCAEAKTCMLCGVTEGDPAGHIWVDANCVSPKTCRVCSITEGTIGNHTYQAATCTYPEVCEICGNTVGEALGCTQGSDGCCIRCGKSMINFSEVLSAPLDSMSEIRSFVSNYYSGECYNAGNFRLIFNSANGVILSWGATNTTKKEIKYITFTINYYNRVGDPAYDSITGKSSYTARMTGPIGAGKSFYFRGLIGYGSDIYYGVISDVTIEYMDGSVCKGNYGYTTWHNIRTGASPKECFIIED